MSGRIMLLGAGAAAGPPPPATSYGDTGLSGTGSNVDLVNHTPQPHGGHSTDFSWIFHALSNANGKWVARGVANNNATFEYQETSAASHITYASPNLGADHYVAARSRIVNGDFHGPALRIDPNTLAAYYLSSSGSNPELRYWSPADGTNTLITSSGGQAFDEARVEARGTTLELFLGGVSQGTITTVGNGNLVGGYCGLYGVWSRATQWYNWHAGPLT